VATQEDILRIVQQVTGEEKIERLSTAYQKAEANLRRYVSALNTSDDAALAGDRGVQTRINRVIQLKEAMEGMQQANPQIASGMKNNAMAMQQFAYGLQDFASSYQYGGIKQSFMAISNNIQMLAVSLGLGTKALLGFTAAGVVLPMLIPKLAEALKGMLPPSLDQEMSDFAKRMEEIGKEADKTRAKLKDPFAFTATIKMPEESKSGAAAQEAFNRLSAEAPGGAGAVARAIVGRAVERGAATNQQVIIARRKRLDLEGRLRELEKTPENEMNRQALQANKAQLRAAIAQTQAEEAKVMSGVRDTAVGEFQQLQQRAFLGDQAALGVLGSEAGSAGYGNIQSAMQQSTVGSLKQQAIARQQMNERLTNPIVAASDALQRGVAGARQAGQKAVEATKRVGDRQQAEAEAWDRETAKAEESGRAAAANIGPKVAAARANMEAMAARNLPSMAALELGQLQGATGQQQAEKLAQMMRASGMAPGAAQQQAADMVSQAQAALEASIRERQATNESLFGLAQMLMQQAAADAAQNAAANRMVRGMQMNNRFQQTLLNRGGQ
jgi:hypothetical protein